MRGPPSSSLESGGIDCTNDVTGEHAASNLVPGICRQAYKHKDAHTHTHKSTIAYGIHIHTHNTHTHTHTHTLSHTHCPTSNAESTTHQHMHVSAQPAFTTSVRLMRLWPKSSSCPESEASPVRIVCTWAKVPISNRWGKGSCVGKFGGERVLQGVHCRRGGHLLSWSRGLCIGCKRTALRSIGRI